MKAILLAGGQGRRLRSITGSLPKPMVPLVGVPVLDRLLDLLRRNGFTDVCMTLCYRPEVIQEHCGDGSSYGVHLKYRIESEPRGTAGGVRACSDFYGREDFLVISGDAACSFDLLGLYRRHQQADAAVTSHSTRTQSRCSMGSCCRTGRGLCSTSSKNRTGSTS